MFSSDFMSDNMGSASSRSGSGFDVRTAQVLGKHNLSEYYLWNTIA